MPNRLSVVSGVVFALAGLALLARFDIPVIYRGGLGAGLAAFDLLAATVVVSALLGAATRQW